MVNFKIMHDAVSGVIFYAQMKILTYFFVLSFLCVKSLLQVDYDCFYEHNFCGPNFYPHTQSMLKFLYK